MRKHAVDGVSLAIGLVFLSFVLWWLLFQLMRDVLPGVGWVVAGALIIAGLVGLLSAGRTSPTRRPAASPAVAPAPRGSDD